VASSSGARGWKSVYFWILSLLHVEDFYRIAIAVHELMLFLIVAFINSDNIHANAQAELL